MRVIAGTAKGHRLFTPKSDLIRPVLDQVKEAIFNILFDVSDFKVLDLFAGTGAMGIEALSRGAGRTVFVDQSREAIELLHKNLEKCGLAKTSQVLPISTGKGIATLGKKREKFDLIFVDPPYERNLVNKTLRDLLKHRLVGPETIIIIEHHPKEPVELPEGIVLTDERKYGQTLISFLKGKGDA